MMLQLNPQSCPERVKDVVFQSMPPDLILLNLDSGFYYSTNPVGAAIWECCDGKTPVAEIVAQLSRRCEVPGGQIEADVRQFVGDLVKEGLLHIHVG